MNKLKILVILFLVVFFSREVLAQTPEELKKFAEIQQALAGDPADWRFRNTDPNNFFYPVPEDPAQVLAREIRARNRMSVQPNPSATVDKLKVSMMGDLLDSDSWFGAVYREAAGGEFFSGNYKLTSTATTELGRIKDVYEQITSRVARFGAPSVDSPATCLLENTGQCRHMATILRESLKDYGITSELVLSPTHVWVRVTLSGPYAGTTFDLDPTWYAQPIPLAPRDGKPIPQNWQNLMLAIAPTATPTLTPTPSISTTPTPTSTPTPTPSVSVTPEPTEKDEDGDNSNSSGPYNYEDNSPGGGWVVPR
ncbi:hypothetical protein HY407_02935 [Candidatus Gottesmanbacteria bacterium]|nr:hypothetical protein [Candidatus Gottesmanbacteria bacterium]